MLTNEQLLECIANGESYSNIAAKFETTVGAIAGRIFRLKKKIRIVIPEKPHKSKLNSKPKKLPQKCKPFASEARVYFSSARKHETFFQPKAVEMTKNEMRAALREAVENTSRM